MIARIKVKIAPKILFLRKSGVSVREHVCYNFLSLFRCLVFVRDLSYCVYKCQQLVRFTKATI